MLADDGPPDVADAEAICEAVERPNMRFVSIKAIGQRDIQSSHRMRSLTVERRTAQINRKCLFY